VSSSDPAAYETAPQIVTGGPPGRSQYLSPDRGFYESLDSTDRA
jgi:hypothetical protein